MTVQIQFRRDTAANWTSVNPLLLQGELGLEYDTGRTKVGDGSNAWNSLPYSPSAAAPGPVGPPVYLEAPEPDEAIVIPIVGPTGPQGQQGPTGPPVYLEAEQPEDPVYLPGPPSLSPSTQNVVTGSRVNGTTYQNITGKPLFVSISAVTTITAISDSSSSPTTIVAQCGGGSTINPFISFIVLPGNYYIVNGPGVNYWVEWY